nr:hypothetical protein [Tanacetum cinerariifolium]
MVINAPCYSDEALAIPGQTATGKENSNPFMADSLPKTILLTIHEICINMSPFEFSLVYLIVTSMLIINVVSSKLMLFGLTIDVAHLMLLEDEDDDNEVSAKPTPPSPTPATPPPPPQQEHIPLPPQAQTTQTSSPPPYQPLQTVDISPSVMTFLNTLLETCATLTKQVANLEQYKIAQAIKITKLKVSSEGISSGLRNAEKVLSMQDTDEVEPTEVEEVIKVVTAAKLMTEVVTIVAATITATQVPKASAPRRRRVIVIQDPKETATASVIVHSKVKSKDKGKEILIEEPKPLKRQAQIKQDEAFARQLEAELNANINWDDVMDKPIFEKHYNSIKAFLKKGEREIKEEGNKRKGENLNQDAVKKQRIDEETDELKTHLQIVANDDDVYTEATPLALKVPVIDYQIHHEHNKPYYKIIRADETHQLFLSFFTLLKNFKREDLEMLWKLVQERFQSSEPNNFSYDFLLNTFNIMYEKPNVEASIQRDQKGRYRLVKVKSWKLFESCKVHIITLITTQRILIVEMKYPLTYFTLEQMLNIVRLEVEEESKMSLELLRLLKLLEENAATAEKMKKLLKVISVVRVILKTFSYNYYCQYKVVSDVQLVSTASIVVNTVNRDENPIRTLGDYSKPSHEGYRNTIELPIRNNVIPLRSDTIWLICSGPHDTQYCMENPEQAFVEYASSCTDKARGKWYTFKLEENNLGDTYNPSWRSHPNLRDRNTTTKEPKPVLEDDFHDLHLNLPILKVLAYALIYNAILDKYIESLELGKYGSVFIQGEVPAKMEDPRLFTLPCRLRDSKPFDTLADLGSCVNIIPLYLFKNLNIELLEETDHIFGLADETKSCPVGIVKDIEVHIGKLKLLDDFYVIDMKKDPKTPLLLGRGFLATANAVIDCRMAKIAVGEGITRSVFKVKGVDLGTRTPYYARKYFLDCHLRGEWEIARDAELNPFKDTLVFKRMVEFLGAIPINLKSSM